MQIPDGWRVSGPKIKADFKFKDFDQAFAFMTAVAQEAERLGHHPDWSNSYNQVHISLSTHSQDKVTDKDIELAEAINKIANE